MIVTPATPKATTGTFARRNRKFQRNFDATLGYPGEGPRARMTSARRAGRSRLQVRPKRKQAFERVLHKRTTPERVAARAGLSLRDGVLAPKTRKLYRVAFLRFWTWVGRRPPDVVNSVAAYDQLLAEYVEAAWNGGHTRGDTGNCISASICAFPELRGRGQLVESWYLLNAWARYEIPIRAPPHASAGRALFGLVVRQKPTSWRGTAHRCRL